MIRNLLRWFGVLLLAIVAAFFALQIWINNHKKGFYEKVSKAISKSFDGELEVGDFAFTPFETGLGLTFSLDNVRLKDRLFSEHSIYLLNAGRISVTLNPGSVISKNIEIKGIRIKDGSLTAFVRKDGYANFDGFKTATPGEQPSMPGQDNFLKRIKKITFTNFKVSYRDSLHRKNLGVFFRNTIANLSANEPVWETTLQGSMLFYGLYFDTAKGGFLVNQEALAHLKINFDEKEKKVHLISSRLWVAGNHKISMSGDFDLKYKPLHWNMKFNTQDIPLRAALALLPKKVEKDVSRFKILPVASGSVFVSDHGTRKPRVTLAFKTDTFQYHFPFGKLNRLKATGTFTNQLNRRYPPGAGNSRIHASKIEGYFETLPIKSELMLTDFSDPKAVIKCRLSADPATINGLFDPKRYRVTDGLLHLNLLYKGNMKKLYDPELDKINGQLVGDISISNAALSYYPQKVHLKKMNGKIVFDQNQIIVKQFTVDDSKNTLHITGRVQDILLALSGSSTRPRAVVNIDIPNWQLNWLEVLLDKQPAPKVEGISVYKLSALVDKAIANMEIEGNIRSDNLQYNRLNAKNLTGKILLTDKMIFLSNLSMTAFGGSVQLSGLLTDPSDTLAYPKVKLSGKIADAKVHSVFYSFNNFGQDAITDGNVKGTLTSDFDLSVLLNKDATLVDSSMQGKLSFIFTNGSIIDFKPFLKVKRMFFKTRSLENVKFAPLQNTVEIRGNEISIKPMEIETNVITLFVEGTYSFGRKTDIMVQVPFSNLKKRDGDYQFVKHDRKALKSLYLRALEEKGEVNIKLDHVLTEKRNKAVIKR